MDTNLANMNVCVGEREREEKFIWWFWGAAAAANVICSLSYQFLIDLIFWKFVLCVQLCIMNGSDHISVISMMPFFWAQRPTSKKKVAPKYM